MEIFVIVLSLAFLQVWGSRNPLHRDAWFFAWQGRIFSSPLQSSELKAFLAIAVPLLVVAVFVEILSRQSVWLSLPFAVIILLYSFGRGEFFEIVREYTQACYIEDWASAVRRAERFGIVADEIEPEVWAELHRRVFDEAAYRGFERMFAVLFWFFVLGPLGALMYRLVFLQRKAHREDVLTERWIRLIEWIPVRLLGLSFALTGNFSGCLSALHDGFFSLRRKAFELISPMALGALSVGEEIEPNCEITRKELTLLSKLYQRSLWFWLGLASVVVIFF